MLRPTTTGKTRYGIVGGLGPLAGADLFFKLVQSTPARCDQDHFDIVIEQHPFSGDHHADQADYTPRRRKFYVYDTIRALEARGIDCVLIGCFLSHSFIDELQPEFQPKILSIFAALAQHLQTCWPQVRRLGVLTSSYVREKGLFEKHLMNHQLVYPGLPEGRVSEAIYGPKGIKAGNLGGEAVPILAAACHDLVRQGAEVIVPGFTEIPIVLNALQALVPVPVIDCNRVYAEYAVAGEQGLRPQPAKPVKLGIVGGVGPAATVDFMQKIIRQTPAGRDQDHLPMFVEHKPQIPDRTANLIGDGADPTIALYDACLKLEGQGATAIAIPCNTAHAFVERIQPHLQIPIINMLKETVDHITATYPHEKTIGLMATSGTVQTGIYKQALAAAGLVCLEPDAHHQQRVMEAIYGQEGVKGGFNRPSCRQLLQSVVNHLAQRGAAVCILGCTELPLIYDEAELSVNDSSGLVTLIDPTQILAMACAQLFARSTVTAAPKADGAARSLEKKPDHGMVSP